jgi:acyl carrier protein
VARGNGPDDRAGRIRVFLARYIQAETLDPDADIFALGFVNSLFAMELVLFVEREFGMTVEDDDLDMDNFRSINALSRLVARKTSSTAQS